MKIPQDFWVTCFSVWISFIQVCNWNSAHIFFFFCPSPFFSSPRHTLQKSPEDTCAPLSHRLQRIETCFLCSIYFDSGVPPAPSQHLPFIYSVSLKQVLTGSFSIPIILITSPDFPCFTYIKFLPLHANFHFFLLIAFNPYASSWKKCHFLMLLVIVSVFHGMLIWATLMPL